MRQLVRIHLTGAGHHVLEAGSGRAALDVLEKEKVSLVVLDVMMPDMDGWETCSKIREFFPNLPVLMLTARTVVEDKVAGLNMGADDYLTKPFDARELVARVGALLRRTTGEISALVFSDIGLSIDVDGRTVEVLGQSIPSTPKEFDLLLLLAKRPGKTFTREELLELVWGFDYFGDNRTVDSHIKNIREKLRNAGLDHDPIVTVWGVGYKFITQA